MRHLFRLSTAAILLSIAVSSLAAQSSEGPETFRFELTGSAWVNSPTGIFRANGTQINIVNDLNAGGRRPNFYGRFVFKPTPRTRLVIEGSPIWFSGVNTLSRSIDFNHQTYNVSETVTTHADANYVFGGYQYDVLSGQYGHLGLQVGVAYFGVQGNLVTTQSGRNETRSLTLPIPLAGTEFRVFPLPHHKILQIDGMMRGVPAGAYGYFVEGTATGGLRHGPIALLAGYREIFADIHRKGFGADGGALRLKGPIFSLQWQW